MLGISTIIVLCQVRALNEMDVDLEFTELTSWQRGEIKLVKAIINHGKCSKGRGQRKPEGQEGLQKAPLKGQ